MRAWLRQSLTILRRAVAEAREDRITTTAQALAYSLFLAIPAAFLLVLGVFSLVATPDDVAGLVDRLEGLVPAEVLELLRESLDRSASSTSSGVLMTVFGALLALWTATSAASALMDGIATAFDAPDARGFVRRRAIALAIVAALVAASLLLVGLLVLGPYLERWIGDVTDAERITSWVWWTAQWPVLVAFLLLAFGIVLYLGPDVDEKQWRIVSPGAVVALAIWLVASGALAVYSARFGSYEKTWGALSAVVVTLLWLWLGAAALLFGAEINSEVRAAERERDGAASPGGGDR